MSLEKNCKVKIFADGANIKGIKSLDKNPLIKGFTTNPTLMKKDGVINYEQFARQVLSSIRNKPISFEVFADDLASMEEQAFKIASWGKNVYVKIPVTNTKGESTAPLVRKLSAAGVQLNVTAIFTFEQTEMILEALSDDTPANISIFAGRIADAGQDPLPLMREAVKLIEKSKPNVELIWASPRELLNIFHAEQVGCHIITVTPGILDKLHLVGKDLDKFSLETVQMFYNDAAKAGYQI